MQTCATCFFYLIQPEIDQCILFIAHVMKLKQFVFHVTAVHIISKYRGVAMVSVATPSERAHAP